MLELDKIKNKISIMRKNKKIYGEYIDSFCRSKRANEIFKKSSEFKELKKYNDLKNVD